VRDDYDPRRASAGKRYRYLVLASPTRDPLLRDRAWHLWGELDLGRLRREALHLPGTHDFAAFRAADCERETTRRHLFSVDVVAGYGGRDDLVAIEVVGTAFLKNMVRIIVGTLVDVARGRLPEGTVAARLVDGDRTRAGMTAPPQGLYLDEVFQRPEWLLPGDVLRAGPGFADGVAVTDAPAASENDENDE
jgi:tRNA pseudouridine38-40 synthase